MHVFYSIRRRRIPEASPEAAMGMEC